MNKLGSCLFFHSCPEEDREPLALTKYHPKGGQPTWRGRSAEGRGNAGCKPGTLGLQSGSRPLSFQIT